MTLRAVVVGAGWAGEGHTIALRHCGVEVAAICARQSDVVQAVAERLAVPVASTNWQQTLAEVRPEIVAIATPASLRGEVVEMATAQGAHLLCDKPLAIDAKEAKRLYELAERAGVKHAYAATQQYDPSIMWMAELLHSGIVGQLQEVDALFRVNGTQAYRPWGWMDQLATGGGMLNNGLSHILAILERTIGGQVMRVTGTAQVLRRRAPYVDSIHDYRQLNMQEPSAEEANRMEWRDCDADNAFSALLQFAARGNDEPPVQVCIILNLMANSVAPTNGWYFYGAKSTIVGEGVFDLKLSHLDGTGERKALPVPQSYIDAFTQVGDSVQNKWVALVQEFVADIRGEAHQPYLTFRDGWRYQAAIDAIRSGSGWHDLPAASLGAHFDKAFVA